MRLLQPALNEGIYVSDLSQSLNDLAAPGTQGSDVAPRNIPEKWRPYAEIGTDGGYAISSPRPEGNLPNAEEILKEHNLKPEDWVVTSYRHGRWQKYDGDWLESSRINMVPATPAGSLHMDLDDLQKMKDGLDNWRPEYTHLTQSGSGVFMIVPSDQQIGKRQGAGGTDLSIARIQKGTQNAITRLGMLRSAGLNLGTGVIALPGDHVEGNTSQGGRLQGLAASDLGQTEQVRVARRLLLSQIKAFAPHFEKVVVPVVNGNHDEVTRQVSADPADGWNVEIAASVQDILLENPAFEHVEFRYPASGHQTLAVKVDDTMLGLFHGHQFSNDVRKYLSGQAVGRTPLGDCDIWVSGHYHHYKTCDIADRLWVQAPTTDPGSDWFRDRTGDTSRPGILTMVFGNGYDPREWTGIVPVE